ncbi:MAG: hypothetical protein ACKV2Q_15295 [Planctomycetaceae bacterium]
MSSPVLNSSAPSQSQQSQLSGVADHYLVSQVVIVVTAGLLLIAGWLLFVVFAVGPTLGFQTQRESPSLLPVKTEQTVKTEPVGDASKATPALPQSVSLPQTVPDKTADLRRAYARQEQLVLLHLQRTEFELRTASLKTAADVLDQRIQKWDRRVQTLSQSDEGKRLAASAREFRLLVSLMPLTKSELDELRGTLTRIRLECTQAVLPIADLSSYDGQLDSIRVKLRSAAATSDSLEAVLDELLASSKPSPDGQTLAEAIDKLDTDDAGRVNQEAVAKQKELQTQFDEDIRAARERLEKLSDKHSKAQSDLEQLETDSAKQVAETQAKRDEQLRELDKQRLAAKKRMEDELPQFRSRLSPFITSGYRQLKSRWGFAVVIDAQPVSYSALLRTGALEDDVEGLRFFLMSAGGDLLEGRNDRPLGSFPRFNSWVIDANKPESIRELKAIRDFLHRHGEAMVEGKLLAP